MRCTCGHDRDRHRHHHDRTYCTHGCTCLAWDPDFPWARVIVWALLVLLTVFLLNL